MSTSKNNKKQSCMSEGLKILGDFWTLYIIQALEIQEKRFCQLERDLIGINPTTLTNRLKKLEQEKIIQRREEVLDKLSVSYILTDKGKAILPILKEIQIFSNKFLT